MADFGNVLRHADHATDVEMVWGIIQNDLAPLKAFVIRKIAHPERRTLLRSSPPLRRARALAKEFVHSGIQD